MARKDWKKANTGGAVDFLWKKRSKSSFRGNQEVWVYKARSKNEKIVWAVTLRNVGGSTLPDRTFRTKSAALRFARSYMRRH